MLPALLIMAMIFFFSSFEGEESTEQSLMISYILAQAGGEIRGMELSPEQLEFLAAAIDGPVRKAAHMTEYGILTLAVWLALIHWIDGKNRILSYTVVICAAYAASDEIHQCFVSERSGSPWDVLVDCAGVLIVTAILAFPRLRGKVARRAG